MLTGHFSKWTPFCEINRIVYSLSKLPLCDSEVFLFSQWYLLIQEFYCKCCSISSWLKNNQKNPTASRSSLLAFACYFRRTETGFIFFYSFSQTGQGCQLQRHWKPFTVVFLTVELPLCHYSLWVFLACYFLPLSSTLKALNSLSSYFFFLLGKCTVKLLNAVKAEWDLNLEVKDPNLTSLPDNSVSVLFRDTARRYCLEVYVCVSRRRRRKVKVCVK